MCLCDAMRGRVMQKRQGCKGGGGILGLQGGVGPEQRGGQRGVARPGIWLFAAAGVSGGAERRAR